jgi:triacylglycerol esterase/lipase EstA (alpha/beta hydrolase family)
VLDALSPQRRRVVLAAAGLVLLLVGALVVAAALRAAAPSPAVRQDEPGPVLLVPGYGGQGDSLQPLASALRATGRTAVVVPGVGDGTGDLQAQAVHLAQVVEDLRAETGAGSVDVIGYSAGGVVARLWVREHGGDAVARRVLTLGAPQHGTSQAALGRELAGGCPTACEQLVPDSDLLRRLNAGDETPDGPEWVTLRSTTDRVVTPVDSATLEGALNVVVQEVCPGSAAGHADLPDSPATRALVASALGASPATRPPVLAGC